MSTVTRPRGPLPPRVYWFRRAVVLVLAFALVYGLAHLLGGRSDSPQARPVQAAVGSTTTAAPTVQPSRPVPPGSAKAVKKGKNVKVGNRVTPTATPTPLAMPTGPCSTDDVQASPKVVGDVYAGSPVTFTVRLHTTTSPACYWKVNPRRLVVRLTSGSDRIWSTQDCPHAVPTERVVVRNDHYTPVEVTWHGQRSDGTCSRTTPWAQPGYYHVQTAVLGSEPAEVQFVLRKPQPETITPSPSPEPKKAKKS
ncbi:MAG: hypothetical protein ACTHOK_09575 [Nocardioidaceae bacterium]